MIKYCPCRVVTGIPFVTRVELSRGSSCHNNKVVLFPNGSRSLHVNDIHVQCLYSAVHELNEMGHIHAFHTCIPSIQCEALIAQCIYVWKLITINSIENQLVMIFLNHRCYCHLGNPRIVSAKYEVILRLATMVFLFDKSHREEEKKLKIKQFQRGLRAIARKPQK